MGLEQGEVSHGTTAILPTHRRTGDRRRFGVRTSQPFPSLRTSGGGDDEACHLSLDPFRPRDLDSCPLASVLECDRSWPLSGCAGTRLGRRLPSPEVFVFLGS